MKIAIFTPYNIFKSGGVQEHVQAQTDILRSRGHTVFVVTPRPRNVKEVDAPDGVLFLGSSARIKTPHATHSDISASVDNEAIDRLLGMDFDIVHVHEPMSPIVGRQLLIRAEGRAIRVGTFHAAMPGNMLGKSLVSTFKSYAKSVAPHIDVITAVSPAAIGYIQDFTELPIHYVPNGIISKDYKPKNIPRDPSLIVFIGRLEKRKGAKMAIDAFRVLKDRKPDARLVIGGDGPLRESLEQYVRDHEIDDVSFLGFISTDKKLELLNTCSIFTSPALYGESFGIVLAEALAMGAPIVCHPNDGYSWVMRDTGRLSLVDCTDANAYADRMQLLMEDQSLQTVWQKWAKQYVEQFDYAKIVDQYEAIYEEALKA